MQNLAVGGLRAARTQPFLAKPEKEEGASGQAPVVPGRYLLEEADSRRVVAFGLHQIHRLLEPLGLAGAGRDRLGRKQTHG